MFASRLINRRLSLLPRFCFSKDYYALLGVPKNATSQEIQSAYSQKAQQFYPEVSTLSQGAEVAAENFQNLSEAYAVLSTIQSRNAYDLMNREQPNMIYGVERESLQRSQEKQEDGNKVRPGYSAGSYAEERRQWLQIERQRFNVDELGRYRGGLPQRDRGTIRGKSLGQVGEHHIPFLHEDKTNPLRSEQRIDGRTAEQFKVWAHEEKEGKQWTYLHQTAVVDYDYFNLNPVKGTWRWSRNLFLLVIAVPWLLEFLKRSNNRSLIEELQVLVNEGKSIEGAVVDGLQVVLGATGTLKLVDKLSHIHH